MVWCALARGFMQIIQNVPIDTLHGTGKKLPCSAGFNFDLLQFTVCGITAGRVLLMFRGHKMIDMLSQTPDVYLLVLYPRLDTPGNLCSHCQDSLVEGKLTAKINSAVVSQKCHAVKGGVLNALKIENYALE